MTRQLLALIALLTGLAAVNAPAHAADAKAVACEVGASLENAAEVSCAVCRVAHQSAAPAKSRSSDGALQLSQLPIHSAPAVLFQVDRAYE